MSHGQYFIALLPPPEIQKKVTDLKLEVAERFGSKHALNAPPHITLHMPFKWKDKRVEELFSLMSKINEELIRFEVELKGFDFFEPRVVFVDVSENESLNELQKIVVNTCRKDLKLDNGNYKNRPFHPHVTIAFRDLKKVMFYEAKEYFQQQAFSESFIVNKVNLLKHDGKSWDELHVN